MRPVEELVMLDQPLDFVSNGKQYSISGAAMTTHGVEAIISWNHGTPGRTTMPFYVVQECLAANTWIWKEDIND